MLITIDTPKYFTGAAVAASVLCWQNFDARLESGHDLALAGRCAR
jgi:hypothetical protein